MVRRMGDQQIPGIDATATHKADSPFTNSALWDSLQELFTIGGHANMTARSHWELEEWKAMERESYNSGVDLFEDFFGKRC